MRFAHYILVLTLASFTSHPTAADDGGEPDIEGRFTALAHARQRFYDSTDEGKIVAEAESLYQSVAARYPDLHSRSEAYLGALQAVRGKHSFLPHNKFIWAMRGLKRMDAALEASPDDFEILFIHAAVCHHLPFFFGRGDDAKRDFRKMIELAPSVHAEYDRQMVIDAFKLIEKAKLTEEELEAARRLRGQLGYMETE